MQAVLGTLTDLELAIDGSIIINDQLYEAMNSIHGRRIPDHWENCFEQISLRDE
jgi:dynein heavy chain